ncbi:hypothetical protein HPB50_002087 [Hyalomma asiaticum]|uniref:Uncharacterized protein n=1 Tax=Hyalomma asiaticum TaxID=266040 RepID=A0ACB7TD32_HYAAI|nr:hypothetical protein HPB50_002087 [Hyalomma asiaticum]
MWSLSGTRKTRLLLMGKVSEKPAESDHASNNPVPNPDALLQLKLAFEAEISFKDTMEAVEAKLCKMQKILDWGNLMGLEEFLRPKKADAEAFTTVRMANGVFVLKPSYYHLMWVHKDSHIVERMPFHKTWRCQHHNKNKKAGPRNANCMARLDVKIKLVTYSTIRTDKYLRRDVPLPAIIRIDARHSHSTQSAEALRLLRGTQTTRQTFLRYFSEGMTPGEARRLHESKLCMEEDGPAQLANGALNPSSRTVYHWHNVWREAHFGGRDIDPLLKLEEKASLYAAQGTHVTVSPGGSSTCWAVLVVTPIMRPAQDLELARDIVFVDSTASCDANKCTVTVVLASTKAGAVPLSVFIHREQNTDGYLAAFKLLKDTHPLCFGGHPGKRAMVQSQREIVLAFMEQYPELAQKASELQHGLTLAYRRRLWQLTD